MRRAYRRPSRGAPPPSTGSTPACDPCRNGTPIAGATGPTLDLSAAGHGDKGDRIAVEVTPSDVYGPGAAPSSDAATIVNSAPVIGGVGAEPGTAVEGAPVAFGAAATDADGDPLAFRWAFGDGRVSDAGPTVTHRYADGPGATP